MGHPPSNQTLNGVPVNRLTVRETAIGLRGTPSPLGSSASGMYTAAATRSANFASCLNDTGYCAIYAISPFRRAPASRELNTYYTPATGTFTRIEGAVATQSLNLDRQYSVAANACSTSELSLRVLVVLTHPTGTSFGLAPAYSSSWYKTPP